jgi:phosphohistidine phosphatase SixA
MHSITRRFILSTAVTLCTLPSAELLAADATGTAELIRALRSGGYVIVMRHASSPRDEPDAANAAVGNEAHERQLDDSGIRSAARMGNALKRLEIPIGEIWSSPTFRARQTISHADLPPPRLAEELGDGGHSMSATQPAQAAWLRSKAAQVPRAGTNTLLVTHFPNIRSAFPNAATGLADGEALIVRPDGAGQWKIAGRVGIEAWPSVVK